MHFTSPYTFHPPGDITVMQWAIALIAGFLLLAFVVGKLIVPMVLRLLDDRQGDIAGAAEQVERTLREAEQVRDDYRERLEHIEDETEARMAAAVEEASRLRESILEEAQHVAEEIVRRGHEEVAREYAKVMARLHGEFVDNVILAAEHAAERSLDDAAQRRLLADFVASVRTV